MANLGNVIVPPGEWINLDAPAPGYPSYDPALRYPLMHQLKILQSQARAGIKVKQSEWSTVWRQVGEVFGNSDPRYLLENDSEFLQQLAAALCEPAATPLPTDELDPGIEKVGALSIEWDLDLDNLFRDTMMNRLTRILCEIRQGQNVNRGFFISVWRGWVNVLSNSNPVYVCKDDLERARYIDSLVTVLTGIRCKPVCGEFSLTVVDVDNAYTDVSTIQVGDNLELTQTGNSSVLITGLPAGIEFYTKEMDGLASTFTAEHNLGRFIAVARVYQPDGEVAQVEVQNKDNDGNVSKNVAQVISSVPMLGTLTLI